MATWPVTPTHGMVLQAACCTPCRAHDIWDAHAHQMRVLCVATGFAVLAIRMPCQGITY